VFSLYECDVKITIFAEIGVGSRTQDPNHFFSGARVVIAHKTDFHRAKIKALSQVFSATV